MTIALPGLCRLRLGLGACTSGLKTIEDSDLKHGAIDPVTLEEFTRGEQVWQLPACEHLLSIPSASRLIAECYKKATFGDQDWHWESTPVCPFCRKPYMDLQDIQTLLKQDKSEFKPPRKNVPFPQTPPPEPPERFEPTSPPSWVIEYDPERERTLQRRLENPFGEDDDNQGRLFSLPRRQRAGNADDEDRATALRERAQRASGFAQEAAIATFAMDQTDPYAAQNVADQIFARSLGFLDYKSLRDQSSLRRRTDPQPYTLDELKAMVPIKVTASLPVGPEHYLVHQDNTTQEYDRGPPVYLRFEFDPRTERLPDHPTGDSFALPEARRQTTHDLMVWLSANVATTTLQRTGSVGLPIVDLLPSSNSSALFDEIKIVVSQLRRADEPDHPLYEVPHVYLCFALHKVLGDVFSPSDGIVSKLVSNFPAPELRSRFAASSNRKIEFASRPHPADPSGETRTELLQVSSWLWMHSENDDSRLKITGFDEDGLQRRAVLQKRLPEAVRYNLGPQGRAAELLAAHRPFSEEEMHRRLGM